MAIFPLLPMLFICENLEYVSYLNDTHWLDKTDTFCLEKETICQVDTSWIQDMKYCAPLVYFTDEH